MTRTVEPSGATAPADSAAAVPPRSDLAGDATVAMLSKALYLVTRLCVPPLVLAHVTLVEYGLWSACFILIMYIGLSDAGFSSVYVRYTARYAAAGDVARINRLMSTGVALLSAIAAIVLASLWLALPSLMDWLKIAPAYRDKAEVLLLGSAGMFLLDLTLGAYCYLLHGLQRIRDEQRIAIAGYLLELALIFVLLEAGMGIYSLLAAFVVRYAYTLTRFIRLAHRLLPDLRVSPRLFDRECLKLFFGFGLAVQASTLVSTALFSLDRLLAGLLLGPKGIALFELGAKLPVSAISVPSAIVNVTLPAASRLSADNQAAEIRSLYRQATRSISLLAGAPLAFMAVFATPLTLAWLGVREDLAELPLILAMAAMSSQLHVMTGPASAVFRALGRVEYEFVYHGLRIVALALGIGAAVAMSGMTPRSLALGLGIGGAVAALAYLAFSQRVLSLPMRDLVFGALLPGLGAYPVALALLALAPVTQLDAAPSRWSALALVAAAGVLYVPIVLGVAWRWILQPEERARLARLAAGLGGLTLNWRKA